MLRRPVIVCAEDDEIDRRLVTDAVLRANPEVELECFEDGLALIERLRDAPASAPRPDLVLLDLCMPRLDGHRVLERLRGDHTLDDIPVVVLSSSSARGDIERAYSGGAVAYARKPRRFSEFVDTMAAILDYWLGHSVRL